MIIDNRLDPINTTLVNPPGSFSAPYRFTTYQRLPYEMWKSQDPSPACDIAVTAGDRQISWCKPNKPNCPMSRNLEPTQRVDPDISYCARDGNVFGLNYEITDKDGSMIEVARPCGGPKKMRRRYHGPSCGCMRCRMKRKTHKGVDTSLIIKILLGIALLVLLLKIVSKS